jgi:hypothetical protein
MGYNEVISPKRLATLMVTDALSSSSAVSRVVTTLTKLQKNINLWRDNTDNANDPAPSCGLIDDIATF